VRRARARVAGKGPDALDVREQGLALLLDQDAAEEVAQQADVPSQRRVGRPVYGSRPDAASRKIVSKPPKSAIEIAA
jgi:hypothetical protein